MIEWLAFPLVVAGAAFIPKGKMSDEKKIKIIFENTKLAVKRGDNIQYPTLQRKTPHEDYTSYHYTLPLGIPSDFIKQIIPALKDGLNKEIEYEFEEGYLKIYVYETELPKKWDYDNDLLHPDTWEVPVGKNHLGILYHDFEKYPHLLVGGVTRFGKTVFMKEAMNTLVLNQPENVEIYILDLKAGLEFYKYRGLPQVKAVACDVFESAELLAHLTEELKKKEIMFREKLYSNIVDTPIQKRTFIIVDEGAELSPQIVKTKQAKKYAEFCQAAISEIARIGGGIGYRLIYATQYPTKEAVPMQVKMNIVARLSFICANNTASQVIIDQPGAEDLPSIPGRAIYLVEKCRTVQVPYIDDKMMFKMMEEKKDVIIHTTESGKPASNNRHSWNRKN